MADILLVEDEANARKVLALGLELHGHQVFSAENLATAQAHLQQHPVDLVLTDLRMQGRDAGLEVIDCVRQQQPDTPVILITAYASADTAVSAMKQGAFDYLTKPVSSEELAAAVERALSDKCQSQADSQSTTTPMPAGNDTLLIGNSTAMQRVRDRLKRAASTEFTVLISGETGTGKELAARIIHVQSPRAKGPFVPVHCGAIPEGLFESELFGHRRGAFTGADHDRTGLIESANRGTLFLDEIGELPLHVQVKLLRALQEKQVRRVGDDYEREIDVRIIAATHRDLAAEVKQGAFREDLFFRLNVIPVHMPALRQRSEDIPLLAEHIVRQWSGGRARLSDDALKTLTALPFMGNVRELENLLQRMLALSEDGELTAALLDELYFGSRESAPASLATLQQQGGDLDQWVTRFEQQLIHEALETSGGNITRAAEALGISFRSLRYRLKKQPPNEA